MELISGGGFLETELILEGSSGPELRSTRGGRLRVERSARTDN